MNIRLIVLFVVLGICLLTGLPMASSIGISYVALLTVSDYPPLNIVVQRMANSVKSFNMMAMPVFIFASSLMVYGNTPRLMKFVNTMLWKMPGELRATVFAARGFFGTVSEFSAASVMAIGKIIGPEMLEQKYPRGLTVRPTTAGETMACIIPPNIVMAVYVSSSRASMEDMFLVGFVPGFICIIAFTGLSTFFAVKRGNRESVERTDYTAKERLKITGDALLPLLTPILVLEGIFSDTCAVTEVSVVVIIYFFTLAVFAYRKPTLREFYKVVVESVVTTGVIMLTISAATPFGWVMSIQNMPILFANWLLSVTSSKLLIMTFTFLLLLLLGTFMETTCIIVLVTPTLLPIIQVSGMEMAHYGIFMLMALVVGSLTPPFSVNLFTACRVLNVKYDEALPNILWVILTATACALLTPVMSEITELLPAILK